MSPASTTIARWLLVAVALDLVVTRLLLRLAIYIPKDPFVGAIAGLVARAGAVVDTALPLLGAVLLASLLLDAGRARALGIRTAGLLLAAAVGAVGIAAIVLPRTPIAVFTGQLLVLVATCLLGAASAGRSLVGVAGALLGVSLALGALGRLLAAGEVLAATDLAADSNAALVTAGELAYLAGAAAVALAGLSALVASRRSARLSVRPAAFPAVRGWLVAGAAIGVLVVVPAVVAPATTGILLTWSLGLNSVVALPVYGLLAALLVAGTGGLAGKPAAASGLGIVLLAGNAPAASGLVLAALLGLAVSARPSSRVSQVTGSASRSPSFVNPVAAGGS